MYSWVKNLDITSLITGTILGSIVGTLMSAWYGYYLKKLKLVVNGGGSGGASGGLYINNISVTNTLGFIGFRLPKTIIFGKMLHRSFHLGGLIIDRDPVQECRAHLFDKQTGDPIRLLWWQGRDLKMTQVATIKSGESANLMLFARFDQQPMRYFVYQSKSEESHDLEIPPEHLMFDGTREFIIRITHAHSTKVLTFNCKMTKGYERLHFNMEKGGSGSL